MGNFRNERILFFLLPCFLFISCNKKLEFYPLQPPIIFDGSIENIDTSRIYCDDYFWKWLEYDREHPRRTDYIAVKNLDLNNLLHLQEVDSFVIKSIAENYADYSSYSICILKYKKIMRNICEGRRGGSNKWYSMWYSEYGLLSYSWEYGEFIERLNLPEHWENIRERMLNDTSTTTEVADEE